MSLVISPSTMRTLEAECIAAGTTAHQLIESARAACTQAITHRWPMLRRVLICAGPGNNGADACVCARRLAQLGISVTLICWQRPITDAWLGAACRAGAVYLEHWDKTLVERLLPHVDLVVDGLLGIGLSRPPADTLLHLIETLNARPRRLPLVAIDVPSGCDAASGAVPSVAVRADVTLSTGPVKVGLCFLPAALHCGEIIELDIGIRLSQTDRRATRVLNSAYAQSLLPARPVDSYKGTYGTVCVWAGSEAYPWAAHLACMATARTGAGIVALAASPAVIPLAWPTPEVTLVPLFDDPHDALVQSHFSTYLVGPGLGRSTQTAQHIQTFLTSADVAGRPVVLDADALTLLARVPDWPQTIAALPCVLTPHFGELRRLAGGTLIDLPPVERAQYYARTWGHVIIMKGSVTVIASPDGRTALWAHPNPVLAVAGSGDVLAGIVAGFIAQHCDLYSAACLAVAVHGLAGQHVAQIAVAGGVLASELAAAIPAAVQALRARS